MTSDATDLIHYHAPQTRSATIRWLFAELGVAHELRLMNLAKGEHKRPEFLAINPMGKVPTVVHKGVAITESPAICAYLADAFPAAELAPAMNDPARGRYYRALFFYSGCVEPAAGDRALKREPGPTVQVGYGTYESMIDGLKDVLGSGPYILGEHFTAADVMLGAGVGYLSDFGLLPEEPVFKSYVARMRARPAYARTVAEEETLLAKLAAEQ